MLLNDDVGEGDGVSFCFGGSPPQKKSENDGKPLSGASLPEPIFMPPPMFTRINHPGAYNFEENPYGPKKQRDWIQTHRVKWDDPEVPKIAPLRGDAETYRKKVRYTKAINEEKLLDEVEKLFRERPVWLRNTLITTLDPALCMTKWLLKMALLAVCYSFEGGPFRFCLCKLGYDPRASPSGGIFQTIDFRTTSKGTIDRLDVLDDLGQGAALGRKNVVAPQIYMLCDLGTQILEFVKARLRNKGITFDGERFGWVGEECLQQIRDRMLVKWSIIREVANKKLYLEDQKES